MAAPPLQIARITGLDASDIETSPIECALASAPVRSIGTYGDELVIVVRASDWPAAGPSGWELAKAMKVTFGVEGSTITLGGYLFTQRTVNAAGFGVDLSGTTFATLPGVPGAQTVTIRLSTWFRHLQDGRGGMLRDQVRNVLGDDGLVDTGHADYLPNSTLIETCLDVLGLGYDTLPTTVDDFDAPGPLDWGLRRALPELDALCNRIGHVPVLRNSGSTVRIVRLRRGGETISVPSGWASIAEPYELSSAPGVRAHKIVVTSGTTRSLVIRTRTLADLEWVYFDTRSGGWLNQTEHAALYAGEPGPESIATLQAGETRSAESRAFRGRIFTALRIKDNPAGTREKMRRVATLPREVTLADGTKLKGTAAVLLARGVRAEPNHVFRNEPEGAEDDLIRLEPVRAIAEHGVFVLPREDGFSYWRTATGAIKDAAALAGDDLVLCWAHEAAENDYRDDYFSVGYNVSVSGGALVFTEMTTTLGGELDTAITRSRDVVKVEAPFLVRVLQWEDGDTDPTPRNDTELKAVALKLAMARAAAQLCQSGEIHLRGFVNAEPGDMDGAVSAVRWDIAGQRTILSVNSHEVAQGWLDAQEARARRSFSAGVGRWSLPGSSAGRADVVQATTPGSEATALSRQPGEIASMAGTRGADAMTGVKAAITDHAPRRPAYMGRWWARITASTAMGGGAVGRWKYHWQQVVPSDTPGTWNTVTGGWTHSSHGYAYSLVEAGNTASGVQGSGIDLDTVPEGFDVVPLGEGAIVELIGPYGADAEPWCMLMTSPSAVDGECPEEPA